MIHKHQRHRKIMTLLREQTLVKLRHLRSVLGVTPMTLWRDVEELREQGLVKRLRGAVMLAEVADEPSYDAKLAEARAAKVRIARKVLELLVRESGSYALEGGTTVGELARMIGGTPCTVLTNSLPVMDEIRGHAGQAAVYCSGGLLRMESGTLVGKEAVTFFSRHKVDVFFMSATGLDLDAGLTDPNPMEIEVKQAMARAARKVVVLLDSSKLGKCSLMQVLPLEKISAVVTDQPVPAAYEARLKAAGVGVVVARA